MKKLLLSVLFVLIIIPLVLGIILSKIEKPKPYPAAKIETQKKVYVSGDKATFVLKLGKEALIEKKTSLIKKVWADETVIQEVTILNPKGEKSNEFETEASKTGADEYTITATQINNTVFPGQQTLNVEVEKEGVRQTISSEFSWGVLALNTNKSLYKPGERAKVAIAVLDHTGRMVCSARVELTVISPSGKKTLLTTSDKSIQVNPQCQSYEYSLIPDYETTYELKEQGNYALELLVEIKNGTYSISDNIEVSTTIPFDIERQTATRIYPPHTYPVSLVIKANQDFHGRVVEKVPASFTVSPSLHQSDDAYDEVKTENGKKVISWNADFKKGGTYILGYSFKTPAQSPYLYVFDKVELKNQVGQEVFIEKRSWQIAADASSTVATATAVDATFFPGQRHIVRTTNGANSKRTFVLLEDGVNGVILYYSDDPDAGSPSWTATAALSAVLNYKGDMVWDETNNVLYVVYGRSTVANNNNADIIYRQITALGTTPVLGTARTVMAGTANSTTYTHASVEIAQDSGTTKVFVFGNKGASGAAPTTTSLRSGTINSDNPTFDTEYDIATWAATANSGTVSICTSNTNKLIFLYWNAADVLAKRHDFSSDAQATSGWDALDGTDNSQTTISSDDPTGYMRGSCVGMPTTDVIWFAWLDASNDINTRRWSQWALDTEMAPVAQSATQVGPTLTTDGTNLWMAYRQVADGTILVYQTRPVWDGTTAWSGTETTIEDNANTVNYPGFAKKIYQNKLDVIFTESVLFNVRNVTLDANYTVTGTIYQSNESIALGDPPCSGYAYTLSFRVNGANEVQVPCNSSDSTFTAGIIATAATDTITMYMNASSSAKANTVMVIGSTRTVSSANLYQDALSVRDDDNASITNAEIADWDKDDDSTNMFFTSNSNNLTVDSNKELHIYTGDTYSPGGTVTTQGTGNLHIDDSAVAIMDTATNTIGNDVTIDTSGTFRVNASTIVAGGDITATGSITTTAGTPTLTMRGTGSISGAGSKTVYNLAIGDGTTATTTLSGSATVNNDVSVAAGSTFNINSDLTVSGGDITNTSTGIINTTSGTPTTTVNGTAATGVGGGAGAVTFYNLTIGGTIPIASAVTVTNDLTANGTMSGTANVTVNGTIAGTGTVTMTGSSTVEQRVAAAENFGTTSGSTNWTFASLLFSNSSGSSRTITTQAGTGSITASTLLQLGKSGDSHATVLDAGAARTWTLSGTSGTVFDIVSPSTSSSLTGNTSTFSYTGANGSGDTTVEDAAYTHLTINASDTFVPAGSAMTVNGDLTVTSGTFSLTSNSITVGSSGTANSGDVAVAGTLTQTSSGTTTVRSSSGGAATIGGAGTLTFYNLTIAPAVASAPTITLGSAGSQTITVSNLLTIGNGSNDVTVNVTSQDPTLDVNGSFVIETAGTFQASNTGTFTIADDFTNNGTFTDNSGTVTLDTTTTATLTGSGSTAITFHNLISTTDNKTIQFTASKTFRFNGLITFTDVSIDSTSGTQWLANHQGTESITSSTITNSGCDGSSTDIEVDSTNINGGNNGTCWVFLDPVVQPRIKGNTGVRGNVRIE